MTKNTLAAEIAARAHTSGLFLASDFDGTVSELVLEPETACLVGGARTALAALSRVATVALISGRALADLRERAPLPAVTLAGEHGADLLLASGERLAPGITSKVVTDALDAFADRARHLLAETGGHVERKKLAVAAHTRAVPAARRKGLEEQLTRAAREYACPGASVLVGKCVIELRAPGVSKAAALRVIRARLAPASFVVALGDDATDEDLFREASPLGVSIKVGPGASAASVRLDSPAHTARFLTTLARELRGL